MEPRGTGGQALVRIRFIDINSNKNMEIRINKSMTACAHIRV